MLVEFSDPALARVAILFCISHAKNNPSYKSAASPTYAPVEEGTPTRKEARYAIKVFLQGL
jgi:hypothetical protein